MPTRLSTSKSNTLIPTCEVLRGGQSYFDRYIKVIEESREVLFIQVYIFNNDATGIMVQDALIRASNRGVKVSLIVDGIGSSHLPGKFLSKFLEAGIEVRFFSKVHFNFPFRMGRRLHLKLLVADCQKAIVGGINIADRYRGVNDQLPWLDFAVYLEGVVCIRLHELGVRILKKKSLRKLLISGSRKNKEHAVPLDVSVLENDFFNNKLQIRKSYIQAIKKAEHSLILFASYFLPSFTLLRLLEKAAERGVEVSLVLPQKIDALFYKTAVKYLYGKLLKKGIRIYEYPPTVLHAKVAVADGKWCTVGSYNLNDLSDILSIELNVEIFDVKIASDFQKQLQTIIQKDCREVPISAYTNNNLFSRLLWRINYFGILFSIKIMHWFTDKNEDYQIA